MNKKLYLILQWTLIFFIACNPPVASEDEEVDPISNVIFSYLQEQNEIFVSASLEDPYDGYNVYSVEMLWYGTQGFDYEIDTTYYLNDGGQFGDILDEDHVYSKRFAANELLPPVVYSDTGMVFLQIRATYSDSSTQIEAGSFSLGNISPRFLWLDIPDTLILPDSGYAKIDTILVEVEDANGIEDIQWVGFTSRHVVPDTMLFNGDYLFLYDDGNEEDHGDATSGDGIYSLIISFPYYAKTGPIEWKFRVQDWSSAWRDTVHTIYILE